MSMLAELLLVSAVREHAARVAPGDGGAAAAAVRTAMSAYIAGASSGEAFRAARQVLGSWSRHPSTAVATRSRALVRAS
jgi:hypothetical protein